ncbi:MAG: murein biosynthesis integral membrane protein MurJ [Chloroflexi bacterium]|nr:murein biosynthesis integral membrane protein MurJ [Chloroflexota bacterium]
MGLKPETASIINEPAAITPTDEHEHVAKATGIVALGNISSRVLGLLREIILSNLFGPGVATDAFNVAIIVPRGLYDLLIGGHVNSALVPVLSEYADRDDRTDLWELVNVLLGLMVMVLSVLVILIEIFAPTIAAIVAGSDAAPETVARATDMLRITAPALFFLSLFAVMSGLLYSLKRFTMPAFAASVFNGTIVIMTLVFAESLGITAAALGWFVGAIVQFAIQFPDLRDARIMPRFKGVLTHPGVRTIAILYLPVMFSLGLDVLINRPFSYNLAAGTGIGNVAIMVWATTLIQFPHGLVATAISIAVLPTLSQQATRQRGLSEFKDTLGLGLRLSTVLIMPATVGLFVLATPVVALIFEHGEFSAGDTVTMSQALRLYLIGLPFAAIDLLLVFAFYARQDTVTPAIIGVVSLLAYMATALLLLPVVGFLSLMIADSVKHFVHGSISAVVLWRRVGGLGRQRLVTTTIRALSVSLVMGGLAYLALQGLEMMFPARTTLNELIYVAGGGVVGVVVYGLLGHWSGLEELHWMVELVRRKLSG